MVLSLTLLTSYFLFELSEKCEVKREQPIQPSIFYLLSERWNKLT